MSQYVLNEWFWADLRGDNGSDRQTATLLFLQRLATSQHQIIIVANSPFDVKAWNLCVTAPEFGRAFVLLLRQNFERCRILHPEDLPPFPPHLEPTIKLDDRYLVQTCLAVPGCTLITTDTPLAAALKSLGISCVSRDEAVAFVI